jgi:DNA gyrase inhibitor GyrI
MKKFETWIEKLDAMRVVVFRGYSTKPEMEAHDLAVAFAKEKGLVDQDNHVKTFGFNKPAPWVTSDDEYGYELWVVVGDEIDVPSYLPVKHFSGAACAVTQIEKLADIGAAWEYLYQWVTENSEFEHAHMDGLEQVLSPLGTPEEQYAFKLYLPVRP